MAPAEPRWLVTFVSIPSTVRTPPERSDRGAANSMSGHGAPLIDMMRASKNRAGADFALTGRGSMQGLSLQPKRPVRAITVVIAHELCRHNPGCLCVQTEPRPLGSRADCRPTGSSAWPDSRTRKRSCHLAEVGPHSDSTRRRRSNRMANWLMHHVQI